MESEKRYLRLFFIAIGVLLGAVGALNLVVDPYGVVRAPRIAHVNANKPDFTEQLRLTHAYVLERLKPRCVLLGTSRTGKGLDPGHPALSGLGCYNAALPSISLYEMLRYFQHAQAGAPQQRVVVGLDFRVFVTDTDRSGAFSEQRLAVDAQNRPHFNVFSAKLPDLARVLFSTQATLSSLRTIRQQAWTRDTLEPDGHWTVINPRFDHAAAFLAYTRNTFDRYARLRESSADIARIRDELRKLIRALYESGAEVSLLISPSHAWHWTAMEIAGLSGRFESIKRAIVAINDEEALRANRAPFAVWDFSGAYGPSLEDVPASPEVGMRWYWEPVHYKRELGDLILDRMLRGAVVPEWPDFGVRLTADNLELHLARLREMQRKYAADHPGVVATIRNLARAPAD